jgi:twitching motility two-component system response regulator PilG
MEDARKTQTLVPGAGSAAKAILVVDGNPALLQTFTTILRASDWNCITAGDTLAALCAVVEHQPRAVLIDADAGPLAVWQFCALLRQHPRYCDIRLIVCSSRDDVVEQVRASAAGADQFLARPFAAEDVLALLASGLEAVA